MFTSPVPQYLPEEHITGSSFGGLKDDPVVQKLVKDTVKPLPPIVRKDGRVLNFFGQAIFTGLGMATTLIISVGVGSWWILVGQKG
jgi:hypothetical protein